MPVLVMESVHRRIPKPRGLHFPGMAERKEEPGHDPDRDVLVRVAAGDVESFGVLVARHEGRIFRLCQRMLHDSEEARDAAQEVFLKAFRKDGSFRPKAKVYTWLYRIAVNHCLNLLRRRKLATFLSFGDVGRPAGAAGAGQARRAGLPPDRGGPRDHRGRRREPIVPRHAKTQEGAGKRRLSCYKRERSR